MSDTAAEIPITGVCVVAGSSPVGYTQITTCHDKPTTEASLWKETGLFGKRTKRFLCYTTMYPLNNGNLVLIDILAQDESQAPPVGFSSLTTTQDTGEPATNKRALYCKLVPRNTASAAINSLVFLCKTRRPPQDYCSVGEINGFLLCYKIGPVPPEAQPAQAPVPQNLPYPISNNPVGSMHMPLPYAVSANQNASTSMNSGHQTNHTDTNHSSGPKVTALTGIPFELCSRLKGATSSGSGCSKGVDFVFQSPFELNRKYNYTFEVEESTAHHLPPELS